MSTDQMILYGFAQKYPEFEVVPDIKMGPLKNYGVDISEGYPEDGAKIREAVRKFITSPEWSTLFEQRLGSIPDPENYEPNPGRIDEYSCDSDNSPS